MIKEVLRKKQLMLNCLTSSTLSWRNRLGTAIDYMNEVGFENIQKTRVELLEYGTKRLLEIEGLKILVLQKKNFRNFVYMKVSYTYDIGTIIDN
jgi:cysteine desulfurase/selenocysteine lyase